MANISHTITVGWTENGAGLQQSNVTVTGQLEQNMSFSLAGSTTNELHALAFARTKLVDFLVFSDQTITLKTNSTGTPQDTITIAAGVPFVWFANSGIPNPFAGDVTASYWSNAGTTAANVVVKCLETQP